ncbi:acyl carrier protein [Catenulispora sp. GAS73]|uniref:acyl carrier protein n=1 Tax=Catenulispora sp. GAS73 TaxID=3156269 RepID=UPI003511E7B6
MDSIEEFVALLRDQVGLELTAQDAPKQLSEIDGWDSLHLLWVLTAVERRTGQAVSLPDLLEAGTLEDVYRVAVGS